MIQEMRGERQEAIKRGEQGVKRWKVIV